jgi:hypothetical protein
MEFPHVHRGNHSFRPKFYGNNLLIEWNACEDNIDPSQRDYILYVGQLLLFKFERYDMDAITDCGRHRCNFNDSIGCQEGITNLLFFKKNIVNHDRELSFTPFHCYNCGEIRHAGYNNVGGYYERICLGCVGIIAGHAEDYLSGMLNFQKSNKCDVYLAPKDVKKEHNRCGYIYCEQYYILEVMRHDYHKYSDKGSATFIDIDTDMECRICHEPDYVNDAGLCEECNSALFKCRIQCNFEHYRLCSNLGLIPDIRDIITMFYIRIALFGGIKN